MFFFVMRIEQEEGCIFEANLSIEHLNLCFGKKKTSLQHQKIKKSRKNRKIKKLKIENPKICKNFKKINKIKKNIKFVVINGVYQKLF